MTSPVLRVNPAGLRELAQRCGALAAGVAPTLPPARASAWQSSGAATSTVSAGVSKAAVAMRGRMTPSCITPLAPRGAGVDGGAGGFEIPR